MATSGAFFTSYQLSELVDEAFERCKLDPEKLTARHAQSARRSLNLMFMEWSNRKDQQHLIDRQTQALAANDAYFDGPAGTLDIILINVKRDDAEIPLEVISRDEWMAIPDKTVTGRPDRVFVEKKLDSVRVHFWPVEESSNTDTMIYYRLKIQEDAGTAQNTADFMVQYSDAIAAGLAARLAEKFAPKEEDKLIMKAERALNFVMQATRERADVVVSFGHERGQKW